MIGSWAAAHPSEVSLHPGSKHLSFGAYARWRRVLFVWSRSGPRYPITLGPFSHLAPFGGAWSGSGSRGVIRWIVVET